MKNHLDNVRELACRLQRYDIPTADETDRYAESLREVSSILNIVRAMFDDAAMANSEARLDRRAFYEGRMSGLASVLRILERGDR